MQTMFSEDVFDDEPPDTRDDEDSLIEITKEVVLRRQAQGFGFRLVGGHEEGTQVSYSSVFVCSLDTHICLGLYWDYCSWWCC